MGYVVSFREGNSACLCASVCPSYKKKRIARGVVPSNVPNVAVFLKSKGSTKSSAEIYGLTIGFPLRPYIQRLSFLGGQAAGGVGFSSRFWGVGGWKTLRFPKTNSKSWK